MEKPEITNVNREKKQFIKLVGIIIVLSIVMLTGRGWSSKQQEAAKMEPTAPFVVLSEVKKTDVSVPKEYVGKVEAIQQANIKAQVPGEIMQVHFKEGSIVKAGQLLFTIDKSQYKATMELRKAEIERAKADLVKTEKYLARVKTADKRSISAADIDTAESNYLQAKAAVSQATAAYKLAQIDYGHTSIKAPVTGRIGKAAFTKGNYVSAQSGHLAEIAQTDPVRIVYSMPDRDYLDNIESFKNNAPVFKTYVVLTNGKKLPVPGTRDFEDNKVDDKTGTVEVNVKFSNTKGYLIPGSLVRVLTEPVKHDIKIVIPQESILADSQGDYVYTVDENNIAHQTRVVLGDEVDMMRKVESGLKEGDRVIRIGTQNVRPESEVTFKENMTSSDVKEN